VVDIIELAREAFMLDVWFENRKEVERFAALVRAQALEEAAVACEDLDEEASWKEDRLASGHECAAAIRALKGEKT